MFCSHFRLKLVDRNSSIYCNLLRIYLQETVINKGSSSEITECHCKLIPFNYLSYINYSFSCIFIHIFIFIYSAVAPLRQQKPKNNHRTRPHVTYLYRKHITYTENIHAIDRKYIPYIKINTKNKKYTPYEEII